MICEDLAGFLTTLSVSTMPAAVVDKARKTVLDAIGNSLGACSNEEGETICKMAEETTSAQEAILFSGGRTALEKAVMINAVLSRIIDLDDGHKYSTGHPSTVIVPTALTVGQTVNASGADVLAAIVGGYEVYVRIARGINVSAHKEKGYDMTGVCGSVAAAATAGMLMGFDRQKLVCAMGIAGSFTGGLYECLFDGSSPKILVPGWAARTGVTAAKLAACGFTGPASIIEGKKGLAQGVTNHYDLSTTLEELGQRFEICGTYFKKYACMRGLHGALDAVLELRDQYGFTSSDVKKVSIYTSRFVKQYDKAFPETLVSTQSNLPYCIAVGLLYPKISMDETQDGLEDEKVREMFSRVEVVLDAAMEEHVSKHFDQLTSARAVVETDAGIFEKTIYLAAGEPERPLSDAEMEGKFYYLAEKTLSAENSKAVCHAVMRLDKMKNVSELMTLMEK